MHTQADTTVILVNLGTPEAPTAPAVRRYLAQFLSDQRVVSIPPLLWQPLLRGIILPLRSRKSAEKYAQVWLPEGSPLAVYTAGLARALATQLPQMRVLHAMRYGQPALATVMDQAVADGARRLIVLPLYPQYSTTTTASVIDVVQQWRLRHQATEVITINDYPVRQGEVAAALRRADAVGNGRGRGQAHRRGLPRVCHRLPGNPGGSGDGLYRNPGRARGEHALHPVPE